MHGSMSLCVGPLWRQQGLRVQKLAQGSVPFWPSVLAQLTGYTEASSPPFASAIAHAGRLCSKLYNSVDPSAAAYMP